METFNRNLEDKAIFSDSEKDAPTVTCQIVEDKDCNRGLKRLCLMQKPTRMQPSPEMIILSPEQLQAIVDWVAGK